MIADGACTWREPTVADLADLSVERIRASKEALRLRQEGARLMGLAMDYERRANLAEKARQNIEQAIIDPPVAPE